nr:heme-binding protein [Kineosporia babensis]
MPPVEEEAGLQAAAVKKGHPLGRLADLEGKWQGTGFNVIWRPHFHPEVRHFLELNLTEETFEFQRIAGAIPNRGLVQKDINMFGLNYLQQITDRNTGAGLHFEPGIFARVPATTNPKEGATIVRMASIPHGTTILAQGNSTAADETPRPVIPRTDIVPFFSGNPKDTGEFDEQHLNRKTRFRTSGPGLKGITQKLLDDPNSLLRDAIAKQNITSSIKLQTSTSTKTVVSGGGVANTAFLAGGDEPNAVASKVSSTFWLEKLDNEGRASQLQYTQRVLLDFDTLSWPHVTVATLRRVG